MDTAWAELAAEGRRAYESGDLFRAHSLLTKALQEGAPYADIHHLLGVVCHGLGRYDEARVAFEAALAINPSYTEAALNLAITYNEMGRYGDAQTLMALGRPGAGERMDVLTRGKIANLHGEVARAYRSAGLAREAAAEYQRALALAPSFADLRLALALTLVEAGALEDAILELKKAVADRPGYVQALLHLGLLLHRTGDTPGARAAFQEVERVEPGHDRAAAYLRMLEPGDSPA